LPVELICDPVDLVVFALRDGGDLGVPFVVDGVAVGDGGRG